MNIFEEVKVKWIEEKLNVHGGRNKNAIVECFGKFGVTPCEDLLALYSTLDGKDCMDKEYFKLWSLEEIESENSSERKFERSMKYGVLFGDYCVNCWCFRINKNGEVLIDHFVENEEPKIRSSSISEFFRLMQQNPDEALI